MTLTITEVATATGVRSSALRYYEERGLIRPVGRQGGRRHYDPEVLSRLALIALCQEAGFTLGEIGTLLDDRPGARERWERLANDKLLQTERHIERLQEMQHHLQAALACTCERLDGCQLVQGAAQRRRTHHGASPSPPTFQASE